MIKDKCSWSELESYSTKLDCTHILRSKDGRILFSMKYIDGYLMSFDSLFSFLFVKEDFRNLSIKETKSFVSNKIENWIVLEVI